MNTRSDLTGSPFHLSRRLSSELAQEADAMTTQHRRSKTRQSNVKGLSEGASGDSGSIAKTRSNSELKPKLVLSGDERETLSYLIRNAISSLAAVKAFWIVGLHGRETLSSLTRQ